MNAAPEPAESITIFTIGFGQKSAREFFGILKAAGVKRVVDVRLSNVSQLAGFTKKDDLSYFLSQINAIAYEHRAELAPTKELLDAYRAGKRSWPEHEARLRALFAEREVENLLVRANMNGACFLCSEPEPDHCHRIVAAEYLRERWGNVEIRHLPD